MSSSPLIAPVEIFQLDWSLSESGKPVLELWVKPVSGVFRGVVAAAIQITLDPSDAAFSGSVGAYAVPTGWTGIVGGTTTLLAALFNSTENSNGQPQYVDPVVETIGIHDGMQRLLSITFEANANVATIAPVQVVVQEFNDSFGYVYTADLTLPETSFTFNTPLTFSGTAGPDLLTGGNGADSLSGGAGDDSIDGGAGADSLIGGTGNDVYWVDDVGDVVTELASDGTDLIRGSISVTLVSNVENLTLTGSASLNATGNALGNVITGNSGDNLIVGLDGDDTFVGGAGNDTLLGGAGNDTASFSGVSSASTVTIGPFGVSVAGLDGQDALVSVERLQFADALVWVSSEIGPELRVNTYSSNEQQHPSVAALSDGGWVVTWMSYDQDNSGWGIYGQRYTAGGAAIGGEFRVNTYTNNDQSDPAVAALSDGGWVVTWTSSGQDGSAGGIYGRRYTAGGAPTGGEFRVNTYTGNNQAHPSVAALSDGGWLVTWMSFGHDGWNYGILAQRYTAGGDATGGECRVNTYTTNDQSYPAVAALSDGGWVVTWTSSGQDGSAGGIYGQRYTAGGAATGGEFRVNTYTNFIQEQPSVAALSDGGWVVTWMSHLQDGSDVGIYGQRYTAGGAATGGEFRINTTTSGDQQYPSVAALTDGGWVVTWMSSNQDGSGQGIYGQRYTAAGAVSGSEFGLSNITLGDQSFPVITTLASEGNSSFLAVWQSPDSDGDGNKAFFTRTFGQAITSGDATSQTLLGTTGADTLIGATGNDTYTVNDTGDVVTEAVNEGDDWINALVSYTLSANVESLTLMGMGNLNGTGNALGNLLIGTSGNNRLDGQSGADTMQGGGGDDTYIVDNVNDLVEENTLSGTDQVLSSVTYTVPSNIERLVLTGTGAIAGTGNTLNNMITGTNADNSLIGLTGADTLFGGGGTDTAVFSGVSAQYVVSALAEGLVISGPDGEDVLRSVERLQFLDLMIERSAGDGFADSLVNAYTSYAQSYPSVAALPDGGWVVTWMSSKQDGSDWGICGQRYTAGGAATGGEFRVNTTTSSDQQYPSVAALPDGGWVVTWMSNGQDGLGYGVYGQRYTAAGAAIGGEFRVNTYTTNDQSDPAVAALSDGGWVVTWQSYGQDGSGYGVYGQRYTAGGAATGGEFRVNAYTIDDQQHPSVAVLSDGGWVVTWMSYDQDSSGSGIYGQRYTAGGGVTGGEFRVNTYTTYDQQHSSVAPLPDGGWVVTWMSRNQDGSGQGIYGQRYTAGGAATGGEFRVNTYTNSEQQYPSVAAMSDGTWVVAWQSTAQDGADSGIYGQRYDAAGQPSGAEIRLNSVTVGSQSNPAITSLAGTSEFIATWDSPDSGDLGIYRARPLQSTSAIYVGDPSDQVISAIVGIVSSDTIDGLAGRDTMVGGSGNDIYIVDRSDDVVTELAGEGSDTVESTASYTLPANVEALTLTGSDTLNGFGNVLSNRLTGNAGANSLEGAEGNDTLDGAASVDTLVGGSGDDLYSVDETSDQVLELEAEGDDTVIASADWTAPVFVEHITLTGTVSLNASGNALSNRLTGNSAANSLQGFAGDDTLDGLAGADSLVGGAGNDTYRVDDAGDLVNELAGEGQDTVESLISYTLTPNVESLVLTGSASSSGTGNALNNRIQGNAGANSIDGSGGVDTMLGGDGNDTYYVDEAGDQVLELVGGGTDIVIASIAFTLTDTGNVENLTLSGSLPITGIGNRLANGITGNSAGNLLQGLSNDDSLYGLDGDDTLDGGSGNDLLSGGGGGMSPCFLRRLATTLLHAPSMVR